jgi:hypothetical protein
MVEKLCKIKSVIKLQPKVHYLFVGNVQSGIVHYKPHAEKQKNKTKILTISYEMKGNRKRA